MKIKNFAEAIPKQIDDDETVKNAEILVCGFLAEHNLSFITMDHLSDLFTNCFPDSKVSFSFAY